MYKLSIILLINILTAFALCELLTNETTKLDYNLKYFKRQHPTGC